MKRKYIVFYTTAHGSGMTEIVLIKKEFPNSIKNVEKIQEELSEALKTSAAITGFQKMGILWK